MRIGTSLTPVADAFGDDLPKRLEPGESATYGVTLENVQALAYAGQVLKDTGNVDDVVMSVELGSGKVLAA